MPRNPSRHPGGAPSLLASDRLPGPTPAEIDWTALATSRELLEPFSDDEIRRLYWLRSTVVAEWHLAPPGQPCPDHQACRRLAFALWLRCTGCLSETRASHDRS